jgi:hypothetical protein
MMLVGIRQPPPGPWERTAAIPLKYLADHDLELSNHDTLVSNQGNGRPNSALTTTGTMINHPVEPSHVAA